MNNPQVSQFGHKNNKFDMKNHYYLFLLFSISGFTHAQELDFIQYSDISSIPQIALNPKIQTELQTLLKHDYLKFQVVFQKVC